MVKIMKFSNISFYLLLFFIVASVIQIPYVFGRIYAMEVLLCLAFISLIAFKKTLKVDYDSIIHLLFGSLLSIYVSFFSIELFFSTWIFYFLSFFFIYNFSKVLDEKQIIKIIFYFLIFHHFFQLSGLLFGVDLFGFGKQGLFANPNNFGLFSAYCFLLSLFLFKISNYKKFSCLSLIICFLMVIFSVSRLCILLVVFVSLSFFIYDFFIKGKYKNISSYIFIIFLISLLITSYYLGYFNQIFEKNNAVDDVGDLSNGRLDMWISAIDRITLWGNGVDFYKYMDTTVHNNYLHVSVVYGLLISLNFLFLYCYFLLKSLIIFYKRKDIFIFTAIISTLFLMIFWCFEVGSSLFVVWFNFLLIGYAVNRSRF